MCHPCMHSPLLSGVRDVRVQGSNVWHGDWIRKLTNHHSFNCASPALLDVLACHPAQLTNHASKRRGVWNVPIILDFIVLNRAGMAKVRAGFGAALVVSPDSTDIAANVVTLQVLSFRPGSGPLLVTAMSLSS